MGHMNSLKYSCIALFGQHFYWSPSLLLANNASGSDGFIASKAVGNVTDERGLPVGQLVVFIYAIDTDQVLEASLDTINPLFNVLSAIFCKSVPTDIKGLPS